MRVVRHLDHALEPWQQAGEEPGGAVVQRHGVLRAGLVGLQAEVDGETGLGLSVALLVGDPDVQEAADIVVAGMWQQRLDAQAADLGLDALGVQQGIADVLAHDVGPANPLNGGIDRVEVQGRLRLDVAKASLQGFVAIEHCVRV